MEECFYFVGNVLVQVRHVFLPNFILKPRGVGVFWNKKISGPNKGNPLNSSIYIFFKNASIKKNLPM